MAIRSYHSNNEYNYDDRPFKKLLSNEIIHRRFMWNHMLACRVLEKSPNF